MWYSFAPQGVCSKGFRFEIENGVIKQFTFTGGCPGNLNGIAKLIAGSAVDDIIARLDGVPACAGSKTKMTSCPDQMRQALMAIRDGNLAPDDPNQVKPALKAFTLGKFAGA